MAGSAAVPAARCRKARRLCFIMFASLFMTDIRGAEFTEYRTSECVLFRLDVGRPDHICPFFGVIGNEPPKNSGRAPDGGDTEAGVPRRDPGVGKSHVDLSGDPFNDFAG